MSKLLHYLHRWERPLVTVIIGGAILLQFIGAWQDSQTTDEAVHIGAGASYWQTGDFRLNPEHPPLIKLLAAAPVFVLPNLQVPIDSPAWLGRDQWNFGAQFLYANFQDLSGAKLLMFLGRIPMILMWALLGGLLFWWARQRWGPIGGIVSLTFFAYDPNFLGHGHLVTTDVGVALFFFASIWAFDQLWRKPSWRWVVMLSLLFAAAQLTKFSGLILWGIIPFLGLLRLAFGQSGFTWKWWWRMVGGLVIITSLSTWLAYGFEAKQIDTDPRINQLWSERQELIDRGVLEEQTGFVRWLVRQSDPETSTGAWLSQAISNRIPAYSYWRGVFSTTTHNYLGHSAYLLGQASQQGWWYYFPVAWFFKTPIITLFVITLAAWFAWIRWHRNTSWSFEIAVVTFPALIYFAWSLFSHINIGVRHIFPVYPFLFLLIGSLAQPWPRLDRWRPVTLTFGMIGIIVTAVVAYPNTIGYFNSFAGGTNGGHRYVLDSNLDWNQDIWRLRTYLDQEAISEYQLALFGSIPYRQIFPEASPILQDREIAAGATPAGLVIISAGQLWNVNGPFQWLQDRSPTKRIGSSILIFDFR